MKSSVSSPSTSHSEQRRAHRFPVALGRQLTVVDIGGRMFDGRVVNISASGLQVVVATDCELHAGTLLQVLLDDVWLPAEVVHAEIAGDKTVAGLRRLQETFAGDDASPATETALRDLLPAGLFFWLVTAALIGLVVVVILSPTPEPKYPAARVRSQPVATTNPAARRPSAGALPHGSSPTGAGRTSASARVRKPDGDRPAAADRRPAKPDATSGAANSSSTPPAEPHAPTATAPKQAADGSSRFSSLFDDPDVADELELDESQRRALLKIQEQTPGDAVNRAALEVLTPAQRARWEKRHATTRPDGEPAAP